MSSAESPRSWPSFSAAERRVLGVMVEKQKTTPDAYPMTLSAITTGCNQKSNRDPVTSYEQDEVEATLQALRQKGAVVKIEGMGRVEKWRHNLYDLLDLRNKPAEMAVLAELLLRGPQTEGELRARASRMDPIDDLAALQKILQSLIDHGLVVYLTPPEQKRGAMVCHTLCPPAELERLKQSATSPARTSEAGSESVTRLTDSAPLRADLDQLRREVEQIQDQIRSIMGELKSLRAELGG